MDNATIEKGNVMTATSDLLDLKLLQLFQVLYARTGAKNVPWTRAHVYRDHP